MITNTLMRSGGGVRDPHFANVALLLHFDALVNGLLSDSGPNKFALNYTGTIDNSTFKFGGGSLHTNSSLGFVGPSTGATIPFGASDFTVEGWVNTTSTGYSAFAVSNTTSGYGFGISWGSAATGFNPNLAATFTTGAGSSPSTTVVCSTTAPDDGTWHHIALVRASGNAVIYVDGVGMASGSLAYNLDAPFNSLGGAGVLATGDAYMDDFRITTGVARYTSNFAPPILPFPNH